VKKLNLFLVVLIFVVLLLLFLNFNFIFSGYSINSISSSSESFTDFVYKSPSSKSIYSFTITDPIDFNKLGFDINAGGGADSLCEGQEQNSGGGIIFCSVFCSGGCSCNGASCSCSGGNKDLINCNGDCCDSTSSSGSSLDKSFS
jgi:hypothetical protein